MSAEGWMDNEEVIHMNNRLLISNFKKKLPFVTIWMALEGIMLSEISQIEKDKFHMTSLICGV